MDTNNEISLDCSNYSQVLMDGVWKLFTNHELTDIVISFNDLEIKVHQMMIGIFAPKLLDILNGYKCDLSGICIDGHNLASIFEFIYRGKVKVPKCDVESLMSLAEELNFKHLLDSIKNYNQTSITKNEFLDVDQMNSSLEANDVKTAAESRDVNCDEEDGNADKNAESESEIEEEVAEKEEDEKVKRKSRLVKERLVVRCPQCQFSTINQKRFLCHLSIEHSINVKNRHKVRYRCVDCEFICDLRSQLNVHRKMEHARKRLRKCPECNFSSVQKRQLDRHVQNTHSTDRPFPCNVCDYRAKCSADLYAHHTTHRGDKFKCEVCSTLISSKKNFNKHMKIHDNPEIHKQPYRCEHCTFRSWTKTLLGKHMKKIHNCEFSSLREDKVKVVIPEEGWQCSLCSYKTKEQNRWIDHLAVKHQIDDIGNQLEPNISCDQCSYSCFVPSQLKRHAIQVHSNKRFKCFYCEYVSYNKTQVTYHMKSKHISEKAFMCETCGMRFVTDCLLRRHVLTHGSDKFSCQICKKTFALQSYLRKHMRHMHDKSAKKHTCHMCDFVTKTKDALNQHMKRMHKEIVEESGMVVVVEEISL